MSDSTEKLTYIMGKYGDSLLRVAYTYMKNNSDAEDILQDLCVKLLEKLPEFDNEEHEKAWLIRCTINLCKNKLKSFWHKNTCELEDTHVYFDTVSDNTELFETVMKLPEKYRMAIHLFYYEGYKTAEISKIMGEKETTVRSLLHRARLQLKESLKEAYDFE